MQQKKHKQSEKSGNYQHLMKMDILDNGNGNVNEVMIWNVTIWITDSGRETVDVFAIE